jgi:uncharacterized membrane protein YgcG
MKTRKKLACVVALVALALAAAACNKAGSSPTATAKAFAEAVKNKDVQGIKNAMSKGSLAMMENFAKMQNKSLDEALKEPNSSPPPTSFESRNEKITGDTATLEIKDEKGKWDEIPFVKEDGQWKIALDKAFQQGMSGGGSEGGGGGEGSGGGGGSQTGGEHGGH